MYFPNRSLFFFTFDVYFYIFYPTQTVSNYYKTKLFKLGTRIELFFFVPIACNVVLKTYIEKNTNLWLVVDNSIDIVSFQYILCFCQFCKSCTSAKVELVSFLHPTK